MNGNTTVTAAPLSQSHTISSPESPIQKSPDEKVTTRHAGAKYQTPDRWRSIWQLITSLVPYAALWYAMYLSMSVSYWLTAGLAAIAAGFLIRIFIIFHDCGHGSFFRSRRANNFWGVFTGILTFAPYYYWRASHARHHATSGDLDKRGFGDVWTMTVDEYLNASPEERRKYRLYRNPFIMFFLGPLYILLITHRFARKDEKARERHSFHWTNAAILLVGAVLSWYMGIGAYLLIQIPVLLIAFSSGVWIFYVQHQFEGVYWERHENWDFVEAAIHGSSHYQLPRILQWFTGNIGFHHIHHLNPRIPNYLLEKCHDENPSLHTPAPVRFLASFKAVTFRLWDEQERKLVGFKNAHREIARRRGLAFK